MTILGDPLINFHYKAHENCVDTLYLTTFDVENTSNVHFYTAKERIVVEGNFVVPNNVQVVFDAPEIVLRNGFKCAGGGRMSTSTEGCGGAPYQATRSEVHAQHTETDDTTEEAETHDHVADNGFSEGLRVTPTLATDYIMIEGGENAEYSIYNIYGQVLYTGMAPQLNVSDWDSGMYVVQQNKTTLRFVVL